MIQPPIECATAGWCGGISVPLRFSLSYGVRYYWSGGGKPSRRRVSGGRALAVPRSTEALAATETAFNEFYAGHRDEVVRALAFTVGSLSLAEEAADEAMARAYQKWSEVSGYENPSGWVYRVGLNWARSWKRSALRRKRREEKVAHSELRTAGGVDAPQFYSQALIDALAKLPVEQRAVVVLRHYCDWSVAEVAAALNISEGTVKSRSNRGLEKLRVILAEEVNP